MKERFYVPIDCPCCHKRGVLALAIAEVEVALEEDSPIMLRCAFDDARWSASPLERHRIACLNAEEAVIANSSWLRLGPTPAEMSHRNG